MALLGKGVIQLIADTSGAIRNLEQAKKSADAVGAAAARSQRSLGKTLSSALKWGMGVAATLSGAAYGIHKVVDAASDLNESINKVEVVFGSAAKEVEAFADKAATSVGMSKQVALEAAGTFGNLFTSMGLARQASADMSVGLVKLAADLASFNNLSPEVVLEKLRSGLVGEVEPLRVLGINLTQAAVKAKAMEMGLISAGEELTQAAALQARYALILEQTKNAQGDFARTSGGLANQMRILKAQWGDLKARLGQVFLPLVLTVTRALNGLLERLASWRGAQGLSHAVDRLRDLAGVVSAVVTGDIGRLSGLFQKMGVPRDAQKAIFRFVVEAPRRLAAMRARIARVWADIRARMGPWVEETFGKIQAWWEENGPTVIAAAQRVFGWLSTVFGWLSTVFGWLLAQVGPVVETLKPLLSGIVDLVLGVIAMIAQAINGDWAGAWATLKETAAKALADLWKALTELFDLVLGWLGSSWPEFVAMWQGIWHNLKIIVKTVLGNVVGTVKAKWGEIKTNTVNKLLDMINAAKEKWGTMKGDLETVLQDMVAAARDKVQAIYQAGVDFIMGFWNGLKEKWEAVKAWVEEKFGWILSLVRSIYNSHSPSRKMRQLGADIMEGWRLGLEQVYRRTDWARYFQLAPVTIGARLQAVVGAEVAAPAGGGRIQMVQVHLHYSPTLSLADEVEMERVLGPFVVEKVREALGGGAAWVPA